MIFPNTQHRVLRHFSGTEHEEPGVRANVYKFAPRISSFLDTIQDSAQSVCLRILYEGSEQKRADPQKRNGTNCPAIFD